MEGMPSLPWRNHAAVPFSTQPGFVLIGSFYHQPMGTMHQPMGTVPLYNLPVSPVGGEKTKNAMTKWRFCHVFFGQIESSSPAFFWR